MRRPVKPFVTEYKAPNRRPQVPAGTSARRVKEDVSASPSWNEVVSRNGGEQGEDAYEAAMRAADALFAPSSRKAAAPSSSDPFRNLDDEDDGGLDADTRAGGRVLRAIDEKPPEDLVAMDVEHAPKRRGRKPGSKNKPKVWSAEAPSIGSMPSSYTFKHVDKETPYKLDVADETDAGEVLPPQILPFAPKPIYISRAPAPYSWVRRKLAPWEQWKRRLPKVCW